MDTSDLNPGTNFFVIAELAEWDGGSPIRKKTIEECNTFCIKATDGRYYYSAYFNVAEAVQALRYQISEQEEKLQALKEWLDEYENLI